MYSVTIYSFWKELVKNFHYFSQVRFYLFILLVMICINQERTKYFDHKYANKYINIMQMYTQLINYVRYAMIAYNCYISRVSSIFLMETSPLLWPNHH